MKRLLILMGMLMLTAPTYAVCSITGGACTASTSNWTSPTLQEKVLPNNLKNFEKSDSFQKGYFEPYHPALINTEQGTPGVQTNDYNSNCQFGVCLPGHSTGAGAEVIE